ncbi:MAG: hypothetical protein L6Q97_13380 [Thermoanaerobaculia bacterium]|nr:hypothetical protein [Thermoanaerobaculia bacterium]
MEEKAVKKMEVKACPVRARGEKLRIKPSKVCITVHTAKKNPPAFVEVKLQSVFGGRPCRPPSLSHHREPNAEIAQTPKTEPRNSFLKTKAAKRPNCSNPIF